MTTPSVTRLTGGSPLEEPPTTVRVYRLTADGAKTFYAGRAGGQHGDDHRLDAVAIWTNGTMSLCRVATGDRSATREEGLAVRAELRTLAGHYGLSHPRVDIAGTVIVHSSDPGYAPVMSYADAATKATGAWVNVVTDDAPAAQVDTEEL